MRNREKDTAEKTVRRQAFLDAAFSLFVEKGIDAVSLDPSVPEETMFSVVFHMMLAAATRYAVGLVYLSHRGSDPEAELVLLEKMILKEYST